MPSAAAGSTRRAVFLDRDGVLNQVVEREGKPASPRALSEFHIAADAAAALSLLQGQELLLFAVTNQPDVARGLLSAAELERMHERLAATLPLAAVRACPHDDADGCRCRKPLPGMLLELAHEWRLDPARCYMIGDSAKDVAAGQAAGCRTVLLDRAYNHGVQADLHADTLLDAARAIVAEVRG